MLFPKLTKFMLKKSKIIFSSSPLFWLIYILFWIYLSYLVYQI
jgi:hypothetical protein